MSATDQQFVQMSDEEAIYQEEVEIMEKRGRRLRRAALTAGVFQAISIVCMIYSTVAIRWVLIEWKQPEKTLYQLGDNLGMFKVGIFADGLAAVADTFVGVLVGMILIGAGVNPATSSLIIVFKVVQQAIMSVNVLFLCVAAVFVDENLGIYNTVSTYFFSSKVPPIGTQMAYIMLLLNKYGIVFAQVFSGVHLGLLGFTIVMWGVFPRWMGYTISLAGPLLVLNALLYIIWPGYDGGLSLVFSFPMLIAQFWLAGWMLVNVPHPAKNRDVMPIFTLNAILNGAAADKAASEAQPAPTA